MNDMSEYKYNPGPRAQTLEEQLIFCELSGRTMKARLLRGTLHAVKIAAEQEAKDLARFREIHDA
jgi:hypothetical protein